MNPPIPTPRPAPAPHVPAGGPWTAVSVLDMDALRDYSPVRFSRNMAVWMVLLRESGRTRNLNIWMTRSQIGAAAAMSPQWASDAIHDLTAAGLLSHTSRFSSTTGRRTVALITLKPAVPPFLTPKETRVSEAARPKETGVSYFEQGLS